MDESVDFSHRAQLVEEIDGLCDYEDLQRCLRHLSIVNRLVFAHRPIFAWLDRIAAVPMVANSPTPLRIVDVGCGYGDMLRRIEHWAQRRRLRVELIGVDINAIGLRAAREATPAGTTIRWIHGDATTHKESAEADVILASGMTHHLAETELVSLLAWMERAARVGWFICDLHREPTPYKIFGMAMRGPWWHRCIRPDGLRSIRRSFRADDWERICAAAGPEATTVAIKEHWPARLCVERTKTA